MQKKLPGPERRDTCGLRKIRKESKIRSAVITKRDRDQLLQIRRTAT